MRFIELTVVGVPGTQGVIRLPMEQGLTVWKPKGTFRLESVVDLLADLLYPAPMRSHLLGPGKAEQASLTVEARGTTYRIARDYARGTTQLLQIEPGTASSLKEVSRELQYVRETLLRSAQLPPQRVFKSLLVSRLADSLALEEQSGISAKGDVAGLDPSTAVVGLHDRLAGLRDECKTLTRIEELNAKLDEHQANAFQIDEQLLRLEGPRQRLADVEREYEEYQVFDGEGVLTPQVVPKLKAYTGHREKRTDDLTAMDERSVEMDSDLAQISDRPFWRETPIFVGAILTPAAFVAVGFVRDSKWLSGLFWLCFFSGLGLLIYGFFSGRARLEKRASLGKEMSGLETERAGIEKRFQIETSVCQKFFDSVGNEDAEELLGMLERHARLSEQRKTEKEEWQKLSQEVPEEKLTEGRKNAQEEISRIEGKLAELPPVTGDLTSVKREIVRLEEEVQPEAEEGSQISSVSQLKLDSLDDPNRLIRLSAELTHRSERDVLMRAEKGLQLNLAKISGGRLRRMDIQQGQILGFEDMDGVRNSWGTLDREMKAAVLFSLQFTFWQVGCTGEEGKPVILDLLGSDLSVGELQKTSLQAAEFLAKKTQVLVLGG